MNATTEHLQSLGLSPDATEEQISARIEELKAKAVEHPIGVGGIVLPAGMDPTKYAARVQALVDAGTPRDIALRLAIDAEVQQMASDRRNGAA